MFPIHDILSSNRIRHGTSSTILTIFSLLAGWGNFITTQQLDCFRWKTTSTSLELNIVSTVVTGTTAIKCYQCTSKADSVCGQDNLPKNPDSSHPAFRYLIDCSTLDGSHRDSTVPSSERYTFCRKQVQDGGYLSLVLPLNCMASIFPPFLICRLFVPLLISFRWSWSLSCVRLHHSLFEAFWKKLILSFSPLFVVAKADDERKIRQRRNRDEPLFQLESIMRNINIKRNRQGKRWVFVISFPPSFDALYVQYTII